MSATLDTNTAVKPIHHWIGGEIYQGQSGRSGAVYNPATGQQTGEVAFATIEEALEELRRRGWAIPPEMR